MPAPVPSLSSAALSPRYLDVRRATSALTAHLSPEDHLLQSMPDASPAKWHLAHTTWFFETFILVPHSAAYREFHADFRTLFNSYYKQLGSHPNRATRGGFSRPTLDHVRAYRQYVDEHMSALLDRDPGPQLTAFIELGLNHEQQHQELIVTDLKHAFWSQPLRPVCINQPSSGPSFRPALAEGGVVPLEFSFPGGIHDIGHSGPGFSFDNELPHHSVLLRPFRLASRLVTNADYVDFIHDNGYRRPELWLSDGWDTVRAQQWQAPLYWERDGDAWRIFTACGMRDLDPAEPVCHVSYYEVDAFARWAGMRLPTEAEWEVAAAGAAIAGNFAESRRFHPAPAAEDSAPQQGSGGLQQMFGDVWEWTASPYVAYPGFRPAEGALGEYNGKFMCNQVVLRGGSCATPQSHMRASYRNFFPPHARWQFMGIRLAADVS